MKKTLLILAVAGLTMASCKKTYTCECTTTTSTTVNGVTTNGTPNTTSNPTAKASKSDAKTACEKDNGTTTSGSATNNVAITLTCGIK